MRRLILLAGFFLVGCQTMPTPPEPVSIMPQPHPGVVIRHGVTKATVIRVTEEEAILSNPVTIYLANGTLKNAMDLIAAQLPSTPAVAFHGKTAELPVRLFHEGTLKEALEQLESQTGLAVSIERGSLVWRDYITREFEMAILPGQRKFSIGGQQGVEDSQYMTALGSDNTWGDLVKSLKAVVGEKGTVVASPMMSTVTASGTPTKVRAVAALISDLNVRLKRQVHLDIKVVQVTIQSKDALGIDWAAVRSTTNTTLALAGKAAVMAPTMTNGVFSVSLGKQTGQYAGSQILVDALQTQGHVKIISEPQVMALNYQAIEQRWVTETTYLASTTSSSTTTTTVQSQTTPDKVVDGVTLFIQPNIGTEYILLHTSLTIANLESMPTIESGGQSIQTPITSKSVFNEITRAKSGQTLVISGLRHVTHKNSRTQPYGASWLKGVSDEREIVETVLIVTPRIVK